MPAIIFYLSGAVRLIKKGIDIGGTFTDLVTYDLEKGEIKIEKIPTDHARPWLPVMESIENRAGYFGDIEEIRHGTTLGVNTIIERSGKKTALMTTRGFKDLLEIKRQRRPELYNLRTRKASPLIPGKSILAISERIGPDGSVIEPLRLTDLEKAVEVLKKEKAESLALLFLNSYADNIHEKKAASAIRSRLPRVYVSVSSEVLPEFREFERLSTTVLNAYLGPVMTEYIDKMLDELRDNGIEAELRICQSDGGITSTETTIDYPVRTLYSGPAAGVMGAKELFGKKYKDLITLDMGGTSTDISLIQESLPVMTTNKEIEGYPIRFPAIDISTIGAGGGSIARVDEGGFLRVGPESMGSSPGPACYGKGGEEFTITDACLLSGLLDPDATLGGNIVLDINKAKTALRRKICSSMDFSLIEGATAALKIAISNISESIKKVTASRGLHTEIMNMAAYGGAGPMLAAFIAEELGIREVIIPHDPGVFSAMGLFYSQLTMDFVKTVRGRSAGGLIEAEKHLMEKGESWFRRERLDKKDQEGTWSIDMRYRGQNYEINIPLKAKATGIEYDKIEESFHRKHGEVFGHRHEKIPVEMVNLRLRCRGRIPIGIKDASGGKKDLLLSGQRDVFFYTENRYLKTGIYKKTGMPGKKKISGPAIIEGFDSTIVIPPGKTGLSDDSGNTIIRVRQNG